MPKYQKKPCIVEAYQVPSPVTFGVVLLATGDWILSLASGAMHALNAATHTAKYSLANDTAIKIGTDWD